MEYLLIFGLISTLSMAYFIQLAVYFYLLYKNQRKKILLPLILFIIMLKGIASFNEGLDNVIFGRFSLNAQTQSLDGDNRTELLKRCWRIFKTSPVTGVGATNLATVVSEKEGFVGANFFVNWASDGILGVLVTYLPFFLLLKLGKYKRQYIYAFIIIILGLIQRPYTDTVLLYPLLSYTLVLHAYLDIRKYKKTSKTIITIK